MHAHTLDNCQSVEEFEAAIAALPAQCDHLILKHCHFQSLTHESITELFSRCQHLKLRQLSIESPERFYDESQKAVALIDTLRSHPIELFAFTWSNLFIYRNEDLIKLFNACQLPSAHTLDLSGNGLSEMKLSDLRSILRGLAESPIHQVNLSDNNFDEWSLEDLRQLSQILFSDAELTQIFVDTELFSEREFVALMHYSPQPAKDLLARSQQIEGLRDNEAMQECCNVLKHCLLQQGRHELVDKTIALIDRALDDPEHADIEALNRHAHYLQQIPSLKQLGIALVAVTAVLAAGLIATIALSTTVPAMMILGTACLGASVATGLCFFQAHQYKKTILAEDQDETNALAANAT